MRKIKLILFSIGGILIFFNGLGFIANSTLDLIEFPSDYLLTDQSNIIEYAFYYFNEMCLSLVLLGVLLVTAGIKLSRISK